MEITGLYVWMPKFGCRFKAYDHRILGFLASDTPDVVPVGKANMLPAQLSKVLYINGLTKRHSQGWGHRVFWIMVYCVVIPPVKEHLRRSIGLPEIYKAMLLLDKRTAPYNLQLLLTYSAATSCPRLYPSHQQPSPSTSENTYSTNTPETG